ncbi:multicopper oxidase family protein [Rhodococcus tibetensis]|uniref:Multicopper oxidase domain-containing protein n=1 Tax=Rhodococcus tibetensis TaxID=2965064 RepID=A0ABT1QHH2_9NOCA|nr:multicopper oxidase domain-containing protein [Rhodococcus sp. FXJ9.536]MCQ4121731.1 multicopper oxidase domain-containing protein [Rhodococcus sp. FXJ9.536]
MGGRIPRRSFVRGLALTAGLGAVGVGSAAAFPFGIDPLRPFVFRSPPLEPFRDPLPLLPTLGGTSVEVHASSTMHIFHSDLAASPALAYGGTDYLGPTIEARVGERTSLVYRNDIASNPLAADVDTRLHGVTEADRTDVPTALHLHGGSNPPEFDGHPEHTLRRGQGLVYEFPNQQDACSLWYHDHAMGVTRLNIFAGLAGLYLLRDEFDTGTAGNPLGLPAGEFEVPLILQDKTFTEDGRQSVRSNPLNPQGSWEAATPGDTGVVNGKVWPEMAVARGLYRLRMVNAASFSVWNLFFDNRMRFWVIGAEGGLFDVPVPVDHVRLGPGERADLLVDFGALGPGATVELRNDEAIPDQVAQRGIVPMPRFCRFRVGAAAGFTGPVPQTLRGGSRQPPLLAPVAQPRTVRNVSVLQIGQGLGQPSPLMSLNNLRYTTDDIEMPRQGAVEQWNIVNATPEPHPIHLHLVRFRVLGRQAVDTVAMMSASPLPAVGTRWTPSPDPFIRGPVQSPQPWESGFKDTVIADANSVTRVVVRFPTAGELGFDPDATFGMSAHPTQHSGGHTDGQASRPLQGYVWHCHMLDHEDHDMMLRYRLVP